MDELGVTLAVLAGGRGERMGKAKGLLRVGDKPILQYLLERFSWRGPTMLVSAPGRERPPGAEGFDVEVMDPVEGMGPVRGVLTALENLRTEFLVVASVDMPLVGREQFLWLMERMEEKQEAWGMMMKRGELEPLPCVFRSARARRPCYEVVAEHLQEGKRSLHSLAAREGFEIVPSPKAWGDEVWTNLNEPGDLAAFERRMRG
jgi:molybdopterin-guanine dinucleotide biosynthesis protein A